MRELGGNLSKFEKVSDWSGRLTYMKKLVKEKTIKGRRVGLPRTSSRRKNTRVRHDGLPRSFFRKISV